MKVIRKKICKFVARKKSNTDEQYDKETDLYQQCAVRVC